MTACKAFDGSVTVLREGRELPVRLLAQGEEPIPVEDGKTVRGRVDAAKAEQRGRGRPTSRRRTILGGDRSSPPPRAWRPEDEAASAGRRAVELWTSPADRRAPFGACGQPVDNPLGRVAIDRAFRRALPTGCPHSRASRPQPHSFGNKFFLRKRGRPEPPKRGHFYFAVTSCIRVVDDAQPQPRS